jgi:hypothetical protein
MDTLTTNLENKQRRAEFNQKVNKKKKDYIKTSYWQGYQVCAQEIELAILKGEIKLK